MKALDRMVQERLPTWSAHGRMPGLTARLQERVWGGITGRLPACWEANEVVLDRLLRLPEVTVGLPMEGQLPHASDLGSGMSSGNSNNSSSGEDAGGYNDGVQVLTHLLRDWAEEGRELRRRTYGPVCRAVARLFPDGGEPHIHTYMCRIDRWRDGVSVCSFSLTIAQHTHMIRTGARIVVPGAGLGRLAFDLAYKHGQRVVALDISPVMAAATASVLRLLLLRHGEEEEGTPTLEFYPFIHDPLINQRSYAARFHRITCPDAAAVQQAQQPAADAGVGSLSLEIGDLLALADAQPGAQDVVVTCYFIDTGKQILDYLWAIQRLLRPGGVWVNIGPLNYHATLLDGAVQLTLEEVEAAAGEMGLVKQVEWDLVPEPCAYRPDPFSESMFLRADVYRPAFGVYRRREEG